MPVGICCVEASTVTYGEDELGKGRIGHFIMSVALLSSRVYSSLGGTTNPGKDIRVLCGVLIQSLLF